MKTLTHEGEEYVNLEEYHRQVDTVEELLVTIDELREKLRAGGKVRGGRKAQAARENGRKGGRPRRTT